MAESAELQTVETLFEQGLQRYQAGEAVGDLLPLFKEICERAPKNSSALTCLSWLYLLADKPNAAYKAASKAIKLNPQDPQARVNLAIAILDSDRKGVRDHIEIAGQILGAVDDLAKEIKQNFKEGLQRKPDWPSLIRVQNWLFD